MEDVGTFYVHLVYFPAILAYFMDIWNISPRFGTFLPVFGMLYQEKSGNPA
jgi:hypothetical protein